MSNYFDDRPPLAPGAAAPPADDDAAASKAASDPRSAAETPAGDPVQARFESCRWHRTQDGGRPYCAHRDVMPYAGMHGFNPEAWCPECTFYKLKRTVRKRQDDFDDDE